MRSIVDRYIVHHKCLQQNSQEITPIINRSIKVIALRSCRNNNHRVENKCDRRFHRKKDKRRRIPLLALSQLNIFAMTALSSLSGISWTMPLDGSASGLIQQLIQQKLVSWTAMLERIGTQSKIRLLTTFMLEFLMNNTWFCNIR